MIKKNLKELSVASRKFANINSWEKQENLLIQRYREILNWEKNYCFMNSTIIIKWKSE